MTLMQAISHTTRYVRLVLGLACALILTLIVPTMTAGQAAGNITAATPIAATVTPLAGAATPVIPAGLPRAGGGGEARHTGTHDLASFVWGMFAVLILCISVNVFVSRQTTHRHE
jgi:hypothetical protein